jgi:hypothetical protein
LHCYGREIIRRDHCPRQASSDGLRNDGDSDDEREHSSYDDDEERGALAQEVHVRE